QDQDKTRYSANTTQLVYDDYTTLDVYGSWAPKALGNITLDMSLNNLTDRYYRKTWSQLDAVGREVILAATYTF
ncbi:TonB-dependent receptor, partial [Oleiphilus sp. HI0080]